MRSIRSDFWDGDEIGYSGWEVEPLCPRKRHFAAFDGDGVCRSEFRVAATRVGRVLLRTNSGVETELRLVEYAVA